MTEPSAQDRSPTPAAEELQALERCVEQPEHDGTDSRPVLVLRSPDELRGAVVRVETWSERGMHHLRAVQPPPAGPVTGVDPTEVRSLVLALLDLADLDTGTAVTELVRTPGGLRVRRCEVWPAAS